MTTADQKPKPVKRPRGEGQWALGYREPLNPNEQSKKDDNPLNVRARIESIYSVRGFDSIDPGDMRGRFRWWGLYTQRRPGIDVFAHVRQGHQDVHRHPPLSDLLREIQRF